MILKSITCNAMLHPTVFAQPSAQWWGHQWVPKMLSATQIALFLGKGGAWEWENSKGREKGQKGLVPFCPTLFQPSMFSWVFTPCPSLLSSSISWSTSFWFHLSAFRRRWVKGPGCGGGKQDRVSCRGIARSFDMLGTYIFDTHPNDKISVIVMAWN